MHFNLEIAVARYLGSTVSDERSADGALAGRGV